MDAQHANLSSSLPTRRSLRTAQSASTPGEAPAEEFNSTPVQPALNQTSSSRNQTPLTRRQLRERAVASTSVEAASVAGSESQSFTHAPEAPAEPVPAAPLTRAELRRARHEEQLQHAVAHSAPFSIPNVEIETVEIEAADVVDAQPNAVVAQSSAVAEDLVEERVVAEAGFDEDLDVAAVLARVQAKLPEHFLEFDEQVSPDPENCTPSEPENTEAPQVPIAASVSDFADRFESYARSHATQTPKQQSSHTSPAPTQEFAASEAVVTEPEFAGADLVSQGVTVHAADAATETAHTQVSAPLADAHTTLRAPAVRMGALGRTTPATELHEHSHAPQAPARTHSRRSQWVPRLAVLGTLGLATIAFPTISYLDKQAPVAQASPEAPAVNVGPSVVEIVNASTVSNDVPSSIAQLVSEDARAYLVASRSEERVPLEGCEATGLVYGTNGKIDTSKLCQIAKGHYLQPDAANAYAELSDAFEARFGEKLCVVSSYRTMTDQYRMKATRGSYAAPPGYSNHGWGTAIDLCGGSYKSNAKWYWLNENAPSYGWEHPSWASRSYEAWHWEYAPGVDELAEF